MSKAVKIVGEKLKEKGLDGSEIALMKLYEGLQEAMPLIVSDEETSAVEKSLAGVAVTILAGLKPTVEKAADLDKDGQVG